MLRRIFEPVSYCAGQELGSLNLGCHLRVAVATLSVHWAVLMPLLVWWAAMQTGEGQ